MDANRQQTVKEVNNPGDIREVEIQPNKGVFLRTEDFIDSALYIPLETTDESEFGEISQIQIVGDFYVILDRFVNEILFFRKNGDYVRKICAQNDDVPIPFESIRKFTVDAERGILSFPDIKSPFVYEFDLSGNFMKIREKGSKDYAIRESYYWNNYRIDYFSYDHSLSNEAKAPSISVSRCGEETISYLYFDPTIIDQDDIYSTQQYFFKSTDRLLFSRPYDYTIYTFGDNGVMSPYVRVSLPESLRLPPDFLVSSAYTNKRRAYTDTNRSIVYLITDVYQSGNIIYCRLMGSAYAKGFLYDLNTEVLVDFRSYLSDSSTHYLPIAGRDILGIDDDRLISAIPAKKMIQAVNTNVSIPGYLSALPNHLRDYYKQGNNQNPILVLTKLKKNIYYETED